MRFELICRGLANHQLAIAIAMFVRRFGLSLVQEADKLSKEFEWRDRFTT